MKVERIISQYYTHTNLCYEKYTHTYVYIEREGGSSSSDNQTYIRTVKTNQLDKNVLFFYKKGVTFRPKNVTFALKKKLVLFSKK